MRVFTILAGGGGVRFWPESRRLRPKQFLSIAPHDSLLQATASRARQAAAWEQISVVTGEVYTAQTRSQLPNLPEANLIQEPAARNTAACLGLAAAIWCQRDPEAVLVVVPADHLIAPKERFCECVAVACKAVEESPKRVCLLGINPTRPATGYGYIEIGKRENAQPATVISVERFREKPDQATAIEFVSSGRHLWNAGIFVWKAQRILELLDRYCPEISRVARRMAATGQVGNWGADERAAFEALPSISVDYAVLEPLSRENVSQLFVIPGDFQWNDVGSWSTWPELWGQDESGNTAIGAHAGLETKDCTIQTSSDHLIATFGVEGLLIVHTPTATLVARRDDEAGLRRLIAEIERQGQERWL